MQGDYKLRLRMMIMVYNEALDVWMDLQGRSDSEAIENDDGSRAVVLGESRRRLWKEAAGLRKDGAQLQQGEKARVWRRQRRWLWFGGWKQHVLNWGGMITKSLSID